MSLYEEHAGAKDHAGATNSVARPGLAPKFWITGLIVLIGLLLWVFASGPINVDLLSGKPESPSRDVIP